MESSKSRNMLRLKFEEEGEIDPEDRLSSLPDSLVGEILSYLEFPCAVATSVLSRRWRHLWTHVTKLYLSWYRFSTPFIGRYSRCISGDGLIRLFSAVDCILRNQTQLNFQHIVLDLYLPSYEPPPDYCYSLLDAFVRRICHPSVETTEITLTHSYDKGATPSIPPCIFQCQSLVSLTLCGVFDIRLPDDGVISLPKLKKLHMSFDDSSRELTGNLFGSFPVVEELELSFSWFESGHFVDISCPNLKKLVIDKAPYSRGSQFRIDAPKLEHFELRDVFSIYSFVGYPSGLIKADIRVEKDVFGGVPNDFSRILKLLHRISNVRSLSLCGPIFDSFEYQDVGLLPVFQNMTYLHSFGDNACIWKGMTICLLCSPNLEELYVYSCCEDTQKWMPPASTSASLLNKLKKVKIDGLDQSADKLQMVQYILDVAKVLELLYVGLDHRSGKSKEIQKLNALKFCKKLFMFPRSSSACEIEFHSSFLKASSKDFKEGSLDG